jgi:hypothetical protein
MLKKDGSNASSECCVKACHGQVTFLCPVCTAVLSCWLQCCLFRCPWFHTITDWAPWPGMGMVLQDVCPCVFKLLPAIVLALLLAVQGFQQDVLRALHGQWYTPVPTHA